MRFYGERNTTLVEKMLQYEVEAQVRCFDSEDGREGLCAPSSKKRAAEIYRTIDLWSAVGKRNATTALDHSETKSAVAASLCRRTPNN